MAGLGRPCALLLGLALLLPAARPGRSDLSLIRPRPPPGPDPDRDQNPDQDPPAASASPSPAPGPAFSLKVQVNDVVSRQPLHRAAVEVFVNHTRTIATVTGGRGAALLRVPFAPGLGLTVLAHKLGYVLAPLAWRPGRMPIYSSLTLSLFPQSPANIWLFDDTVLITGKLAEAKSQPRVQFAKASIALPDSHHFSNVTGYLTVLRQFLRTGGAPYAAGVTLSKAGFESIELTPLAAVCVKMYSGGRELQVAGSVQLSLPLLHTQDVRAGDHVPAWTFDMDTGAWVSHGRGTVREADSHLVWTYDAPHLGYWMAAPLPGTRGPGAGGEPGDMAAYHTAFLTAILGGTVVIVVGFFAVLLCYCRDRCGPPQKRDRTITKLEALRRDQTTSTTHIHHIGSVQAALRAEDRAAPRGARSPARSPQRPGPEGRLAVVRTQDHFRLYGEDVSFLSARPKACPGAPTPAPEPPRGDAPEEALRLLAGPPEGYAEGYAEGYGLPEPLLHLYRPPLALLRSADLLAPEPRPEAKAATLPRKGEPGGRGPFAQTLPTAPGRPPAGPEEGAPRGGPPSPPPGAAWARYPRSLLESVSVPGTLSRAVVVAPLAAAELQGVSEQTLRELSRARPCPHPRAWFVSLDGTPVAPVRHSFIDLRRGRRGRGHDHDASLDSGVDLREPPARRPERERERTFLRGARPGPADPDLSSSESGTAVCSPEDPAPEPAGPGHPGPGHPGPGHPGPGHPGPGRDPGAGASPTGKRGRPPLAKRDGKASIWRKREERPLLPIN
ncbi:protein FAM171B [Pipistrellus kuhlii]|uniref:protein FAM171B n=1 Tax=Pipistrellus kuhlii TaxID=59472 RepID=UPI001E271B38|nr:protein FAM171B [Pipistrellus kuhlii]